MPSASSASLSVVSYFLSSFHTFRWFCVFQHLPHFHSQSGNAVSENSVGTEEQLGKSRNVKSLTHLFFCTYLIFVKELSIVRRMHRPREGNTLQPVFIKHSCPCALNDTAVDTVPRNHPCLHSACCGNQCSDRRKAISVIYSGLFRKQAQ